MLIKVAESQLPRPVNAASEASPERGSLVLPVVIEKRVNLPDPCRINGAVNPAILSYLNVSGGCFPRRRLFAGR